MYKFFISQNQREAENAKIIGEDVNHIANVLRLKPAEKLVLCIKETGKSYEAEIKEITRESILCHLLEEIQETTEPSVKVDIYQGLPKADKMEYIIQKATEIGVRDIYPVAMERSIVKLDKKTESKKIERWQKIAEVAAKQSKRDKIPTIKNVINVENICKNAPEYDKIIIAFENEEENTLKRELKKLEKTKQQSIAVVIGPEGGIAEKELQQLEEAGARSITLGKRILRTETASLVVLSNIIYELEE